MQDIDQASLPAVIATKFAKFVAVDWTGARGERHRSIAVAVCETGSAGPVVLTPDRPWTRAEVFALIAGFAARSERVLVGMDFSFSLPFADAGNYFPGDASPPDARTLWAEVAWIAAADPHHAAHAYVDHRRRHFWCGAADGPRRPLARLRTVEHLDAAAGGVPSSCFVLRGAAQCGKASLSGMRLLDTLDGVAVWPFDPLPARGPVLVEIYCRIFAKAGGVRGKIRDRATLDAALARLGSGPADVPATFADHIGDAVISAAGLRRIADDERWWHPPGLTPAIARTEGWTFGVA